MRARGLQEVCRLRVLARWAMYRLLVHASTSSRAGSLREWALLFQAPTTAANSPLCTPLTPKSVFSCISTCSLFTSSAKADHITYDHLCAGRQRRAQHAGIVGKLLIGFRTVSRVGSATESIAYRTRYAVRILRTPRFAYTPGSRICLRRALFGRPVNGTFKQAQAVNQPGTTRRKQV